MNEIFVDVLTTDIIEALEKHRVKHTEEYEEAVVEYWKQVKDEFAEQTTNSLHTIETQNLNDTANIYISLNAPVNRDTEYANQINMFRHSLQANQKVHNLSQQHFNNIVNDQFDWAVSAKLSNSAYTTRIG